MRLPPGRAGNMLLAAGNHGCNLRASHLRASFAAAGKTHMRRLIFGGIALALVPASGAGAQSRDINEIKGKIFDAHMAERLFAKGLKFCGELDGKNFYFAPRDRVLNLDDYHRSLDSLVEQRVFNPEARRAWTAQDAAARWERVKQEAAKNKADCDLVASLPALEKQLGDLEKTPQASPTKN
jgi:hypothetical protein